MKHSVFTRFFQRKTAILGLVLLALIFLTALFGPLLTPYDPFAQNLGEIYAPPSARHWLGTDYLGRDMLTRLIYGSRVTLGISLSGVLCGSFIGIFIGLFAGYYGGWVDHLLSGLNTVLLAFPGLLLALMVVAILGMGTLNTAIAVAIFNIPYIARIVRGLTHTVKNLEYIEACKVMGASDLRILAGHVVPNCISQIIVNVTLSFGTAILSASGLSFLGLGVQAPNPEWGAMLNYGKDSIRTFPAGVIIPGVAIMLAVMGFSLFGDGLRDALDPQLKNR